MNLCSCSLFPFPFFFSQIFWSVLVSACHYSFSSTSYRSNEVVQEKKKTEQRMSIYSYLLFWLHNFPARCIERGRCRFLTCASILQTEKVYAMHTGARTEKKKREEKKRAYPLSKCLYQRHTYTRTYTRTYILVRLNIIYTSLLALFHSFCTLYVPWYLDISEKCCQWGATARARTREKKKLKKWNVRACPMMGKYSTQLHVKSRVCGPSIRGGWVGWVGWGCTLLSTSINAGYEFGYDR